MDWIVSPPATPSSNAQVLTHTSSVFDLIWRWGIYRGKPVKVSSFGWLLTQYDQCPIKKGKSGHRHAQTEDYVKRHREKMAPTCHGERPGSDPFLAALRKNQPSRHFCLGLPSHQNREVMCLCGLSHRVCGTLCGSPSWLRKCAKHVTRLSSINLPTHPVRQKWYQPTRQTRKLKHRAGKCSVWNHTVSKRPSSTLNSRGPEQRKVQKAWFLHSFETVIRSQARLTIIQLFFILNMKKISCT